MKYGKRKRLQHYEDKSATSLDEDISLLQCQSNLNECGAKKIFCSLQDGTVEIKNLLLNECDIIYECKICRNLFRSFENIVAHKRAYCCTQFAKPNRLSHNDEISDIEPTQSSSSVDNNDASNQFDGNDPTMTMRSNSILVKDNLQNSLNQNEEMTVAELETIKHLCETVKTNINKENESDTRVSHQDVESNETSTHQLVHLENYLGQSNLCNDNKNARNIIEIDDSSDESLENNEKDIPSKQILPSTKHKNNIGLCSTSEEAQNVIEIIEKKPDKISVNLSTIKNEKCDGTITSGEDGADVALNFIEIVPKVEEENQQDDEERKQNPAEGTSYSEQGDIRADDNSADEDSVNEDVSDSDEDECDKIIDLNKSINLNKSIGTKESAKTKLEISSKKIMEAKKVIDKKGHYLRDPCSSKCSLKCNSNIHESLRKQIHDSFWSRGKHARKQFVCDHVTVKKNTNTSSNRKVARNYHFNLPNGEPIKVCVAMFLGTLGYHHKNDYFISAATRNKGGGFVSKDGNVCHQPTSEFIHDKIIEHIK